MQKAVVADQIVYSGTSFVIGIVAARTLSVAEFGQFSLVFATALLLLGLQRAMSSEPLLVTVESGDLSVNVATQALVRTLSVGLVSALTAMAILLALGGTSPWVVTLVGSLSILPFVQDLTRFVALTACGARWMLGLDAVNALSQVTAMTLVSLSEVEGVTPFIAAWSIGSAVGPLLLVWPLRRRLSPARGRSSRFNRMSWSFGLDYVLGAGAAQGTLYAATWMSGYNATAALRGAETIIGPFRVILQTLPALLLRRWSGPMRSRRSLLSLSIAGILAIPLSVAALVALFIPADIGFAILGATWTVAAPVLPVSILGLIPISLTFTCTLGLKSLGLSTQLIQARLIAFPIVLGFGVGGAVLGGSFLAAVGLAAGSAIASLIFLTILIRQES